MIWVFFFFSLLFFSCKDFMYFCDNVGVSSLELLMLSVSPMVFFLVFYFLFAVLGSFEGSFYKYVFGFVILLVSCCFLTGNSFIYLVLLELTAVPMCALVLWLSKDADKISSVFFMTFTNLAGSLPFMFFVSLTFIFAPCFFCTSYLYSLSKAWSFLSYFFFSILLLCKVPLFFFHYWLTKAHVAASGSCSMVLASLMLKMGTFGLMKFNSFFLEVSQSVLNLMCYLCYFSMFFFLLVMYRSFDFKYMIAGSSVVHMALIIPSCAIFNCLGVLGSIFMMVSHGLVSYFLFLLVTSLYEAKHSRSLELSGTLESFSKSLAFVIFVCLFLNLGFPPFMSFFSEFLFCTFFNCFSSAFLLMLLICMTLSVGYLLLIISKVYFGSVSKLSLGGFSGPDLLSKSFFFFTTLFAIIFVS